MLGRIATGAIILFWLAMMGLLAQREILPGLAQARELAHTPNYRQLETHADLPRIDQMGIYMGEQRIGQSVTTVIKEEQDNELQIRNRTDVRLGLAGGIPLLSKFMAVELHLKFTAHVVDARLLNFNMVVTVGGEEPYAVVDGFVVGKELTLRIRQGGQTRVQTIPFDPQQMISANLMPALAPAKLRVGETWTMRSMDIQSMALRDAVATVRSREQVKIGGQMRDAFVIDVPSAPGSSESFTVWVSPEGEVLMQKFLGFRLEREEPVPEKDSAKP